jgi:hypothetical protein
MTMTRIDFLLIRRKFAEKGIELTPDELFQFFNYYHQVCRSTFAIGVDGDYDEYIIADILERIDNLKAC